MESRPFVFGSRLRAALHRLSGGRPPAAFLEDLVAANRILAREGVLDAFGHVSARSPARADRFHLARCLAPGLVGREDLQEYDLDGLSADGRNGYLERFIHSEIYRARAGVGAIVHCHTPSLIPFADSSVPLRPMYHLSAFIGESVPVFDLREEAGMTDMLVSDAARGRALARSLGARAAALIRGHGAVVVGPDLPTAVGRSIYLDLNARMQARAIALGGEVTYLDAEETRGLEGNDYDRAWEVWKRQVRE